MTAIPAFPHVLIDAGFVGYAQLHYDANSAIVRGIITHRTSEESEEQGRMWRSMIVGIDGVRVYLQQSDSIYSFGIFDPLCGLILENESENSLCEIVGGLEMTRPMFHF